MRNTISYLLLLLTIASCNQKQDKYAEILQNENSKVQEIIPDSIRAKQISDLTFGMFICWSFSTFSGNEWTQNVSNPSYFTATGCNTDLWCQTAKNAGMNYILFLTKHHDGFCLWDTKTTELKVTNSPLGIDVLHELRKSCDKYGLKLALYFSEGDWSWLGRIGTQSGENPEMKRAQLKELCTDYGSIEFFWLDHATNDGGLSHEETTKWVHKFQPNCFIGYNHGAPSGRLCIRERGTPGSLGDSKASKYNKENESTYTDYLVAEFTYPILPAHKGGADWFYSLPIHDTLSLSAEKIHEDYLGALKYGNIFSLNIGPNYEGDLREIDINALLEVGNLITENTKP